jgi:hypothetical protein
MKKVRSFFNNLFGIVIFFAFIVIISLIFDYLSPKLITLGWTAYIVVGILESIVIGSLQIGLMLIFVPLFYLVTSKSAKILCTLIAAIGFFYSVITPWQYANIIGFRFIVIIWCVTLTIFISVLFISFVWAILFSSESRKLP